MCDDGDDYYYSFSFKPFSLLVYPPQSLTGNSQT